VTLTLLDDLSTPKIYRTLYGETPGGTKIKYTLEEFKKLSKSPLCQKAPIDLPDIPGLTTPLREDDEKQDTSSPIRVNGKYSEKEDIEEEGDTVFDMEM